MLRVWLRHSTVHAVLPCTLNFRRNARPFAQQRNRQFVSMSCTYIYMVLFQERFLSAMLHQAWDAHEGKGGAGTGICAVTTD